MEIINKAKIKWFLLGFISCFFLILALIAYNIFYSSRSFQVDLHTYSISLPTGEILFYTHDSCSESDISSGEHILTLAKKDKTWESLELNSEFSSFEEFILATSDDKYKVWAIDPIEKNWIEWNMENYQITEHINEVPPEFSRYNRYVYIEKIKGYNHAFAL